MLPLPIFGSDSQSFSPIFGSVLIVAKQNSLEKMGLKLMPLLSFFAHSFEQSSREAFPEMW